MCQGFLKAVGSVSSQKFGFNNNNNKVKEKEVVRIIYSELNKKDDQHASHFIIAGPARENGHGVILANPIFMFQTLQFDCQFKRVRQPYRSLLRR